MSDLFPIVFETEDSGVVSAYVAGLPVYAQGATRTKAQQAIIRTLAAYVAEHPDVRSRADVKVARLSVSATRRPHIRLTTAAALVGSRTSARKAASSRVNGRLGGRPRKVPQ